MPTQKDTKTSTYTTLQQYHFNSVVPHHSGEQNVIGRSVIHDPDQQINAVRGTGSHMNITDAYGLGASMCAPTYTVRYC